MKTLYEKTLTGREVEILTSPDRRLAGLRGLVLLEQENILHIRVGNRVVKIPKKDLVLKVYEDSSYRILSYPEFEGSYIRRLRRL